MDGINEEIRLLNEEDDLFTGGTAATQTSTILNRKTSEIPPIFQAQEPPQPDTLTTPLIPEKVNNPLPQRSKSQ